MGILNILSSALSIGDKVLDRLESPERRHKKIVEGRLKTREDLSKAIREKDLAAVNRIVARNRIELSRYRAKKG